MGVEHFLELLLSKSMAFLQWTSLGSNPFASSKLPSLGEEREMGKLGDFHLKKREKKKGGGRVSAAL